MRMQKRFYSLVAMVCCLSLPALGQDPAGWFPFTPKDTFPAAPIHMAHWLDKPAGKHGFLQMRGKAGVFEDGRPGHHRYLCSFLSK